jgi:hypothetical protein
MINGEEGLQYIPKQLPTMLQLLIVGEEELHVTPTVARLKLQ